MDLNGIDTLLVIGMQKHSLDQAAVILLTHRGHARYQPAVADCALVEVVWGGNFAFYHNLYS